MCDQMRQFDFVSCVLIASQELLHFRLAHDSYDLSSLSHTRCCYRTRLSRTSVTTLIHELLSRDSWTFLVQEIKHKKDGVLDIAPLASRTSPAMFADGLSAASTNRCRLCLIPSAKRIPRPLHPSSSFYPIVPIYHTPRRSMSKLCCAPAIWPMFVFDLNIVEEVPQYLCTWQGNFVHSSFSLEITRFTFQLPTLKCLPSLPETEDICRSFSSSCSEDSGFCQTNSLFALVKNESWFYSIHFCRRGSINPKCLRPSHYPRFMILGSEKEKRCVRLTVEMCLSYKISLTLHKVWELESVWLW